MNTAFLHGDLLEEVYMKPPSGLKLTNPNQVCKLKKSLYGLKQASRQWHTKLTVVLIDCGYQKSKADYSLFVRNTGHSFTAILVYVDDLVIAGDSLAEINALKRILDDKFSIKDLGALKYFLGFEVARTKEGLHMCQRKYALDLLQDSGLLACKPCSTPMDSGIKFIKDQDAPYADITSYRRLIGRLIYLTHTRPDISHAISILSQYLSAPCHEHYTATQRILRYIKRDPGLGLYFPSNSTMELRGFTDSNWANCPDTRRSTSGFCFFFGSALISWKSKKQRTVSRSSSEAEYRALALGGCEAQWLIYLLNDLQIHSSQPVVIYCDNHSAIHIA